MPSLHRLGLVVAIIATTSPALAESVSSVSQYGVTWTFDKAYEVGKFATGDYWVVGPVVIQSVSPAPTATRNGSCVNPMGGRQGYDDRGGAWQTDDRVTFPYTLTVDQSLVSSVSKAEGAETFNVGCLQSQAVLTAVAAAPAATALRPSYAGTYKKYFDSSQILWQLLPNLPAPASKPSGTELITESDRPRIDHLSSWEIQFSCAEENWNNGPGAHNCYGREVSTFVSEAAQYVMLDTPERNELATNMIQMGIDNYGVLKAGGAWAPNGGHHSGRKWPIVFAAKLLNDCEMLAVGSAYDDSHFGEDGQTYYGTSGKALFGWDCGGGQGSYFENGCSGNGAKDCRNPAGAVDGCDDYRNCCTSGYWVGQMLATLMLDSKAIWNHDAYFDYVDRWMTSDVTGGGSASSSFVEEMWSLYRNKLPAPTTAPGCDGGVSPSGGGTTGNGGSGATSSGATTGSGGVGGGGELDASTSGGGSSSGAKKDDDGGCGCRTLPSKSSSHALWALVLLFARRRARRLSA